MLNLIGVGLMILGVVLTNITEFAPFCAIAIIGVFLFTSFLSDVLFCDYVIANSNVALTRKRYYIHNIVPLLIISYILTLGRATLKIVWKEEYYKFDVSTKESVKLTRKEYIVLRNEQRTVYSTQTLSREFMEAAYSPEIIGFGRKKLRLIAVIVLAALMLTMLVEPEGIWLTIIYEAVFVPMVVLWVPEYKDAKILQQAYDRAMNTPTES